jgi:hypothetical protein
LVSYLLRHVFTSTLFFEPTPDSLTEPLFILIVLYRELPLASSYDKVTKSTSPEVAFVKKSKQ